MNTRVITAHLPLDLAEKVDAMAAVMDRPRAWIVKQALSQMIEASEERDRLTLEALAEVRAGKVIDHERMRAWAAKLGTPEREPLPKP